MIYKKDANFPYPILSDTSYNYKNCTFTLDVDLNENIHKYRFEIDYENESEFIKDLINNGQAQLILVIKSKDNKFFNLKVGQKSIEVAKSRISLSKKTSIQLLIKSKEEISFKDNYDLNSFYDEYKESIVVPKNSILGFSNVVLFNGSCTKPLEIFEKKIDSSLKSDIKIELGCETIIINYRNEDLQFVGFNANTTLNNPYIYMGLQKALYNFILKYSDDREVIDLDDIEMPDEGLDFKLYNLMKNKMVTEVSLENIDEVIYKISDKILEKYVNAIGRLLK